MAEFRDPDQVSTGAYGVPGSEVYWLVIGPVSLELTWPVWERMVKEMNDCHEAHHSGDGSDPERG